MRVLHVIAGAPFGGAETAFVDLITALKKRGVDQHAVIRSHLQRAHQLTELAVPVTQVPFRKWFDWETPRALREVSQKFQPHIVQTWMERATTMLPKVSACHVGWLGGFYKVQSYRACRHIVGVTPGIIKHMVDNGWPAHKADVLRTFAVIEEAQPIDRCLYDTPVDAPLLLGLGRLHSDKAFDVLLKALVNVPEAYLWIAGDGVLRHELPQLAQRLGVANRVRFLGWRTDRAALLKTCDICAFPSRVEPFGTVIVEAWAYQAPLVTAASTGPREHVHHGDNGMIVPIDDVDALTDALRCVINDPVLRKRIVEGGWRDYQEKFTEEVVVSQYLALYNRLLS